MLRLDARFHRPTDHSLRNMKNSLRQKTGNLAKLWWTEPAESEIFELCHTELAG
jgi:hypothetical protein